MKKGDVNEVVKPKYYYSKISGEDSLKELQSSKEGLSDREVSIRLSRYGYNEAAKKVRKSVFSRIFSKFLNPLVLILLVIVAFSLFFGEKINAIIISVMIAISIIIDFFQEYNSEKAVEKLNELIKTKVTVYRDKKEKEINIRDLVPGDIVLLFPGDMVPADLRIISSNELFINQSSLTGESIPVRKTPDILDTTSDSISGLNNLAFMGSSVVSGNGLGLVTNTGLSTEFGEISKVIASDKGATNFDKGIKSFTFLMIKFILFLVLLIFVVIFLLKKGSFEEALLFSLAVAVGLTPEMLPMMVTINLSRGAKKMAVKKVIVKHLNSIQNFGAMDILCTDKTGTLTQDKVILQKHCDIRGKEDESVFRLTYMNSFFQTGLKNLLEHAILSHKIIPLSDYAKISEKPFDFSRKIISVVVSEKKKKHDNLMICKGAPEEIFKRCSYYELDGRIRKIDDRIFKNLKKEYNLLSSEGFIVLAIAYKNIKNQANFNEDEETDLVLKGYAAFLDPPKHSTKEAIIHLEKLGVEIKILTGDNEIITEKICNDVDIQIKGILTGDMINNMSDKELSIKVEKNTIFARLNPIEKERIIKILRANGHVVGYLGDGINDAASLKVSDVGISVNNAVDIAKESADIILLEKDLLVLKDGVLEGRRTFGNIIKYIKMGSSSNFGNMFSMAGATIFLPFLPMLPIQVLFNNFLYDMSQITLPTDNVDEEYLKKPHDWNIGYIKKFMLYIGPLSSIYDFLTFGVMLFIFKATPELFQTGWFIESLFTQTLIIYIIRTNKIPFLQSRPSKLFLFSTLAILAFAAILPFTPLAVFFGFVPLPWLYFGILLLMIVTYLGLVQVVKTWLIKKYGYQ